jgi:hypothetical protein
MSNKLNKAVDLAKAGFWLFPLSEGKPAVDDLHVESTREESFLKQWFAGDDDHSIGIYTGNFSDNAALIVVDVSNSKGEESVLSLDFDGRELPATLEQSTAAGGRQLIYRARTAYATGVTTLGAGVAIHSRDSFILAADTTNGKSPSPAPAWLVDCLRQPERDDEDEDQDDECGPPDLTPDSVGALNKKYALVGGSLVFEETTDEDGNSVVKRHKLQAFMTWFENKRLTLKVGNKLVEKSLAQWWLRDEARREYESVVFAPGRTVDKRFYNLWTGFTVEPVPTGTPEHPALIMFKKHALNNVCNGNKELFNWLMGFFAHIIQNPSVKPMVAPVFKGRKGVGKNVLVESVGALLGRHFMVADDERYLLGQFNAHLENCLFLVLDEANWAGDKKAEGRLKGIITGTKHVIEYKNQEAYQAKNLTRIAIIGNENWLVPATEDERRFAVFSVGDGNFQDDLFFGALHDGMKFGGYAHLLRYLLDFDLSTVNVNRAPKTEGLIEQKKESLELVEKWWLSCLEEGQLLGGDRSEDLVGIPERIASNRLQAAFVEWATKSLRTRNRLPTPTSFGRSLSKVAASLEKRKVAKKEAGDTSWTYFSPGIDVLRADFERFIGGACKWED